jgi:RNA-directed DNA polymerase
VSLTTPDSVRPLQRALYVKAKQEPEFRFYLLYDKVYRKDILTHAYRLSRDARGAAGVDGMTFTDIETAGVEPWLAALRKELRDQTYRPTPGRRVMIPNQAAASGRSGFRRFGTESCKPP